jgi:hypothetical protein
VERDLESGLYLCTVTLEFAWEPRYRPFYLEPTDISVEFAPDAAGNRLKVTQPGKGYESVVGRLAHQVELRVPAPKRSTPTMASLKGNIKTIGPTKMLLFTFPKLRPIRQPADALSETHEGVRLTLRKFATNEERWTVEMALDYPPGGPTFESFQSWLGNNSIVLESGKQRLQPKSGDQQILLMTNNQAVIHYHFTPPAKARLVDWSLVYQTPGRILETTVPFEFQNLPLP